MKTRTKAIWSIGIVGAITYFFWFEIPAVANNEPDDTLSEFVWWLLEVHPIVGALIAAILLALCAWLPVHWLGKGKYDKPVSGFFKRLIRKEK